MTGRLRCLLLLAALGCGACGTVSDPVPTATVQGRDYGVSVIRGIKLEAEDIAPFAPIDRATDPSIFLDRQAFSIKDVDPDTMLVVQLKPGLRDDAGPWGEYLGLMGPGRDPDLCRYFTRLAPTWCEAPRGT